MILVNLVLSCVNLVKLELHFPEFASLQSSGWLWATFSFRIFCMKFETKQQSLTSLLHSKGLLHISSWMSNRHLQVDLSKIDLLISTCPHKNPISVNGPLINLAAWVQRLNFTTMPLFSFFHIPLPICSLLGWPYLQNKSQISPFLTTSIATSLRHDNTISILPVLNT